MDRRGFIGSILALGAAPAIVRSGILMPVRDIRVATFNEIASLVSQCAPLQADVNAMARAALTDWWARQFDDALYSYQAAAQDGPRIIRIAA